MPSAQARQARDGEGAIVGAAHLDAAQRRTRVRIAVRNPNVGAAAAKQAGRTAQLQAIRNLPVQAQTRLEEANAVEAAVVREVEAIKEGLVEERLIRGVEQVVTEAGDQGEIVTQVDGVLQTEGPAVVLELRGHGVDAAAQRHGDIEFVGLAALQIGDRIEIPGARRALREQVADILRATLHHRLQRVVVHLQRRVEFDVQRLRFQLVGLAADVRTKGQLARASRAGVAGSGGGGCKAGAEFTKAGVAAHRLLQTGVIRIGHAHLGGEIVRPLVV